MSTEDEGVDMKEVDGLLSETAVMLGRWSLYTRFLATKTAVSCHYIKSSMTAVGCLYKKVLD